MNDLLENTDTINYLLNNFNNDTLFNLVHTSSSIRKVIHENNNLPSIWEILIQTNKDNEIKFKKKNVFIKYNINKLTPLLHSQTLLYKNYIENNIEEVEFIKMLKLQVTKYRTELNILKKKEMNLSLLLKKNNEKIIFGNKNPTNIMLKYIIYQNNEYIYVDKLYINQRSNCIHTKACGSLSQSQNYKCITIDETKYLSNIIQLQYCSRCVSKIKLILSNKY